MNNYFYRIIHSDEALQVITRFDNIMRLLAEFEEKLFADWASMVPSQIERNLKRSLLTHTKNNSELLLNFHPQVRYPHK